MNINQLTANLFHSLQRNGHVVDESAAFLLWAEFASEDAIGLKIEVVFLKEGLQSVVFQFKLCFHHAFLVLVVKHIRIGTVAQGKAQGTEQDGLARTSFARDDIETAFETDIQFVYQGVVTDVQLLEHGMGIYLPLFCSIASYLDDCEGSTAFMMLAASVRNFISPCEKTWMISSRLLSTISCRK